MLASLVDKRDRVPPDRARRTLMAVYQPDHPIDLGVAGAAEVHWHRSRFLRVGRDPLNERLVVLAPTRADGAHLVNTKQEILVHYRVEAQGFAFISLVTSRGLEASGSGVKIPAVRLLPPDEIYYHQRRQAIRIKPSETIPMTIVYRASETATDESIVGVIEDLSTGGARVRFDDFEWQQAEDLQAAVSVGATFTLASEPSLVDFAMNAEVVRTSRQMKPRRSLWLAMKWREPSREDTQALSRFVFVEERAMLRRRRDMLTGGPGRDS